LGEILKKLTNVVCIAAIFGIGSCVQAETIQVSNVSYQVVMDEGNRFESPTGAKGYYGVTTHATLVRDNGALASQWCLQENGEGDDGQPTGVAGYCTIIEDNGDVLWVSFLGTPAEGVSWTVMGGTGQWAGATGGGTSEMVSQRADGEAWASKSTGTITTPSQ
jgi:hypothetical protein